MILETPTAERVEIPKGRTRLVRLVGNGDTITASRSGKVLGVFRVLWTQHAGQRVAILNQQGTEAATLVGEAGAEVLEGFRVAITQRRPGKPKRSLLFLMDPAIRILHTAEAQHA